MSHRVALRAAYRRGDPPVVALWSSRPVAITGWISSDALTLNARPLRHRADLVTAAISVDHECSSLGSPRGLHLQRRPAKARG